MKKFLKTNIKIILGFVLGLVWSSGIAYAAANGYLFDSNEVSYDNTASGLESTNVQDALDELYVNSDAYLAGLNAAHPIGSIFMTVNSNYNTAAKVGAALGGTWEAIGSGRVLQGADSSHTAGSTIAAGLPDITGEIHALASNGSSYMGHIANGLYGDGAFTGKTAAGGAFYPSLGSTNNNTASYLEFNASSSNSIYGNSTTVQPPAYVVYMYKRTA